jgi:rhamnosyltransferase
VAIITYNAASILKRCLLPLIDSPVRPKILVVNSSSRDGTVELAGQMGVDTLVVPRNEFNHGLTRELARKRLQTDIVVMLTPDAWLESDRSLEMLVQPIRCGRAAVAYARQLPRSAAGPIERFNREFNYPARGAIRSMDDWSIYGSDVHFCSNACAAWSNAALDSIGGFPATIVSEETVAAASLLRRGHRIAYVAEARVFHSHPPSLWRDFKRQFDTGYTRALFFELLLGGERDEVRGLRYSRNLLRTIMRQRALLLPAALGHLASSYLGYRLGLFGPKMPIFLSRLLSSQDFFWRSKALRLTLRQAI